MCHVSKWARVEMSYNLAQLLSFFEEGTEIHSNILNLRLTFNLFFFFSKIASLFSTSNSIHWLARGGKKKASMFVSEGAGLLKADVESIWANVSCQPLNFAAKYMCPGIHRSHLSLINVVLEYRVNMCRGHETRCPCKVEWKLQGAHSLWEVQMKTIVFRKKYNQCLVLKLLGKWQLWWFILWNKQNLLSKMAIFIFICAATWCGLTLQT